MKQFSSTVALFTLLLVPFLIHADPLTVPRVDDWSEEATVSVSQKKPILVVFSSESCNYCDKLNDQVLNPMLENGHLSARVHLREFKIDRGGKVIDFDGEFVRSRIFVSRYHIFATPTVLLLDPEGKMIGDPLIGYNDVTSYNELLNHMIEQAGSSPIRSASLKTTIQ